MHITKIVVGIMALIGITIIACSNIEKSTVTTIPTKTATSITKKPAKQLSEAFKKYWYAGNAEITSYELQQARYGEIRSGSAALIYVTEDFLPKIQVKADQQAANNVPVLKLNSTKKFLTGIYPYSIMQSTFYPVADNQHAIKVSSSMQEWCGHVYAQLNNRDKFDIMSHSYFEGEADQELQLDKTILENELWTRIRINPTDLPIGNFTSIPAFEYLRLKHTPIKAYEATASLSSSEGTTSYEIAYPALKRSLKINFSTAFPHEILGWEETFSSFGKELTTKATRKKTIKSAYWGKNSNKDLELREQLGL